MEDAGRLAEQRDADKEYILIVPADSPDGAKRNPGYESTMFRYRRNVVPGGTYFFSVTLADRTSSALVLGGQYDERYAKPVEDQLDEFE